MIQNFISDLWQVSDAILYIWIFMIEKSNYACANFTIWILIRKLLRTIPSYCWRLNLIHIIRSFTRLFDMIITFFKIVYSIHTRTHTCIQTDEHFQEGQFVKYYLFSLTLYLYETYTYDIGVCQSGKFIWLLCMSYIVRREEEKVKALYEILIFSPRWGRLCKRRFMSDICVMLLWLIQIISLKSMEHNRNYYYDISKRFLWMIGQWPYQKPKTGRSFLALVVIVLANCLFTQVTYYRQEIFSGL